MLRIWSEFLPYEELRRPSVLTLLARHRAHPLVAVHHDADLDALAQTLRAIAEAGLEPSIWPLLAPADGYWASERTLTPYLARVEALIDHLEERGCPPRWVAVDLEPPLGQVTRLMRSVVRLPLVAAELGRANLDPARYAAAHAQLAAGLRRLRARGVRSLGVTTPLAAHDLRDGQPLWQDLLETPWDDLPWDAAGIMAYGSMLAGYSRGLLDADAARAVHDPLLRRVAARFGPRAHASIGVTAAGVLGDEPVYHDPQQLGRDAGAARAAGVDDLAIFCLEGILGRRDPDGWLRAARQAPTKPAAPSWRARSIRLSGAVLRAVLRRLCL